MLDTIFFRSMLQEIDDAPLCLKIRWSMPQMQFSEFISFFQKFIPRFGIQDLVGQILQFFRVLIITKPLL